MLKPLVVILFCTSVLTLSGCASKVPTFADRVLADGESRIDIAELWQDGNKAVLNGEKQMKAGRKAIATGRADVSKGEQYVAAGNLTVKEQRNAYQALLQRAMQHDNANTALKTADKLTDIAKEWQDAEEKIAEGKALIKSGKANIAEGESDLNEGQQLIKSGREKMREAESRYQKKEE